MVRRRRRRRSSGRWRRAGPRTPGGLASRTRCSCRPQATASTRYHHRPHRHLTHTCQHHPYPPASTSGNTSSRSGSTRLPVWLGAAEEAAGYLVEWKDHTLEEERDDGQDRIQLEPEEEECPLRGVRGGEATEGTQGGGARSAMQSHRNSRRWSRQSTSRPFCELSRQHVSISPTMMTTMTPKAVG